MIGRRALLTAGAALLVLPRARAEAPSQLALRGAFEQGGLVIGQTGPGWAVTLDGVAVKVSAAGLFCFGLAYDAVQPLTVVATFAAARETASVTPRARQYDIQRIDGLPGRFVEPPPEVAERMAREHAAIAAVREKASDGVGFAEPLDWPAAGRLSGVYGSQRILNGVPKAPHLGVDIAAPEGTPIHAPADGVVAIADDYYLEGGFTLLDHGHGVTSCYLHQSRQLVKAGDVVRRGQVIGEIGQTGRATGPHCHWGLNWFQVKLDPSRATRTLEPPRA
jgi:murein DD-endopeptidase MepM/ murein hydrolase activator NlpD